MYWAWPIYRICNLFNLFSTISYIINTYYIVNLKILVKNILEKEQYKSLCNLITFSTIVLFKNTITYCTYYNNSTILRAKLQIKLIYIKFYLFYGKNFNYNQSFNFYEKVVFIFVN